MRGAHTNLRSDVQPVRDRRLLDVLNGEHALVKDIVEALAQVGGRLREGRHVSPELATDLVAALGRCVEQVHMEKEERVIFPYLHQRGIPRSTAVVTALSDQHDTIRVYARRMRHACERLTMGDLEAGAELATVIGDFLALTREHLRIEDQYFYALADQAVAFGDHEFLLRQFQDVDDVADATDARACAERVLARCREEL